MATSTTSTARSLNPELVQAGPRVSWLGRSSVRYDVGLFVERGAQRPVPISEAIRAALDAIRAGAA